MLPLIVCALVLSVTSNIECKYTSDYHYHSGAGGWLKLHKVVASWQQAFVQCHYEGAVLASPLTRELRHAMQRVIDKNDNSLSYFIGAHSKFTPGQYVSIEGVPLANMPTADMYQLLDTEHGECLSTNGYNISVMACTKRLPYLCYKKDDGKNLTECGTFDREYRFEPRTGSCYKLHLDMKSWFDANSLCVTEGAYLAIINNDEEAREFTKMIPDKRVPWITADRNWEPLYVGIKDWTDGGLWLTNHGDPLTQVFDVWNVNQPDAVVGQKCGAINRLGKLDNIWCSPQASSFICEKDPYNVRYSIDQEVDQTLDPTDKNTK